VGRGVASTALTALSQQVDLVVIGSPHRRGTAERLSLGGAGKALVQSCQAPLLIVPAPSQSSPRRLGIARAGIGQRLPHPLSAISAAGRRLGLTRLASVLIQQSLDRSA
jgi:hypothetical protein